VRVWLKGCCLWCCVGVEIVGRGGAVFVLCVCGVLWWCEVFGWGGVELSLGGGGVGGGGFFLGCWVGFVGFCVRMWGVLVGEG